jgi:predicted enzyme related to lactoylglutathione lyase
LGNPVTHFELMGPNGDAQRDFYSNVFDWQVNEVEGFGGYYLVQTGDGQLGGAVGQGSEEMPNYVTIYVSVDEIDAKLEEIENAGGQTVLPRTEIPDMVTYALFKDPAGNLVGLVEG